MRRQQPTPDPTEVSTYFFQQLDHSTDAATPITAAKKIDKETENAVSRYEVDRTIAAVLKDHFTPAEVKALLHSFTEEEHSRSETLEEFLEVSWRRVEDIIERNKRRRHVLEEEVPHALTEMDTYIFWTPDSVAARYKIPGPKDFGFLSRVQANTTCTGADKMDQLDTVPTHQLDEYSNTTARDVSLAEPLPPIPPRNTTTTTTTTTNGTTANDTATVLGKHRAKAWTMTSKELLDPSKSPHSLRRLFAPILRQREQLPRSLTLLLNAVQSVQTERFPKIEANIEKGFFDMPIHRSFRFISSFITRYLSEDSKGEAEERELTKEYKLASKRLADGYEQLRQLGAKKTKPSARDGATDVIYNTLLTELRERKRFHERCEREVKCITEAASTSLEEVERALQECEKESRRTLGDLEENTKKYMSGLSGACERIKASREEINAVHECEHKLLQTSIDSKLYHAKKSEAQQEKIARRIRELAKELYTEQTKYEGLIQEIIAERVSLRQLELSHSQLVSELDARVTSAGFEVLDWASDSLQQSEECRARLIKECQLHVGRLKTEDHYRRCRVAGHISDNALNWSRCLHDLAFLCESHYDLLTEKCNTSLQMRYLLAYEKDQVVKDLQHIQHEISLLDAKWAAHVSLLEELDMPIPPLAQYEKDPSCLELRRVLCQLDSSQLIRGASVRVAPVSDEVPTCPPADTSHLAALDSQA